MKNSSTYFLRLLIMVMPFLFLSIRGFAQAGNKALPLNATFKTAYFDTIHIRGLVLDATGKPVPGIQIASRNYIITGKVLHTKTDSDGRFNIDGAKLNDSLTISGTGPYEMTFYNNGSRYVEITLPAIKPNPINSEADPILIQAKATSLRKKLKLTYKDLTCPHCTVDIFESITQFPGGNDKLITLIKRQLIYPEQAIKNNIQGIVKITFWIQKDGSVINPHIVQGIGYGCDEEVMRLISKSPKWHPAFNPLVYPESIAVKFMLTDK